MDLCGYYTIALNIEKLLLKDNPEVKHTCSASLANKYKFNSIPPIPHMTRVPAFSMPSIPQMTPEFKRGLFICASIGAVALLVSFAPIEIPAGIGASIGTVLAACGHQIIQFLEKCKQVLQTA